MLVDAGTTASSSIIARPTILAIPRIANAYSQTVVDATPFNHVSFNGGTGGVSLQPTVQQLAVGHQQHTAPLPVQAQHIQAAAANQALLASANHGHPPIAATSRPAVFSGQGVVPRVGPSLLEPSNNNTRRVRPGRPLWDMPVSSPCVRRPPPAPFPSSKLQLRVARPSRPAAHYRE